MAFQLIPTIYAATTATNCDDAGGANKIDLGECLKLSNNQTVKDVYDTPAGLVNLIVDNLFVLAGVIIFLLIFYVGFKMISGGKKGFDESKTILTSAIAGLIIMICAYWIVQLVGYLTGVDVGL